MTWGSHMDFPEGGVCCRCPGIVVQIYHCWGHSLVVRGSHGGVKPRVALGCSLPSVSVVSSFLSGYREAPTDIALLRWFSPAAYMVWVWRLVILRAGPPYLTRVTPSPAREGIFHVVGSLARCLVKLHDKNIISKHVRNKSESLWKAILFWIKLEHQIQCILYVLGFPSCEFPWLPRGCDNKWRPPIEAVWNSANIKCT